jgi:hypothetical protein
VLTRRKPLARAAFRSKASTSAGARSVPIARSTPIRKFREEPRRVDRATGRTDEPTPFERDYMSRVRELECCALGMPGHAKCAGPPIVHHAGQHGMGFKSEHTSTIRLCDTAHVELHGHTGWVKHWTGQEIRAWEDGQVLVTQRRLGFVVDDTTV